MEMHIEEQIVVVIGAAQGIGRAIASTFAAEMAKVALLDVSGTVSPTAEEIAHRHGASTIGLAVDATDYLATLASRDEIERRLGPCDHLIYAAGLGSGKSGKPFWNLEPEDWNRVLQVNLLGAVNAAHAFAPGMAKRKKGTILFLSSIAGQIGSQTDPPYSAAKAAVINFAQCAAKDLAQYGVRVNTICPGMVRTELNRAVWRAWADLQAPDQQTDYETWAQEKIRRVAPLGRWQEPEEIAAMAVYLASPHARNVTGQTLNVDGGQVMHS